MHARPRQRTLTSNATAQRSASAARRNRRASLVAACAAGLLALTGCAKMDAALGKQWMVVDFNPGTSVATVLHVRAACAHVQNAPAMALPVKRSVVAMMYGVRFDTTNASPANLAELQTCLQQFPSVQGVEPQDAGDEGS